MKLPLAVLLLLSITFVAACASKPTENQKRTTTKAYAEINGFKMYYEIHGQPLPGQVPLVLLHGGAGSIDSNFGDLLPRWMDRQVIAFDQQGHGRSTDADRPFTFKSSAEDVAALLKHLQIEKADLFGYSNGGHISLQLALDYPGMVNKLVIMSAQTSREGSPAEFWQIFKGEPRMPQELSEEYQRLSPHPEKLELVTQKLSERMGSFKGWSSKEIQSISAPILWMAGDRDTVRPEHLVKMYRLNKDAQLFILPNIDHLSIVRQGALIAPVVQNFLNLKSP